MQASTEALHTYVDLVTHLHVPLQIHYAGAYIYIRVTTFLSNIGGEVTKKRHTDVKSYSVR
jgi:hypothetical protein